LATSAFLCDPDKRGDNRDLSPVKREVRGGEKRAHDVGLERAVLEIADHVPLQK